MKREYILFSQETEDLPTDFGQHIWRHTKPPRKPDIGLMERNGKNPKR